MCARPLPLFGGGHLFGWPAVVFVGLFVGCQSVSGRGAEAAPVVTPPETMEACARDAAAKRADDGERAPFRTTVHLRVELSAYRATGLCVVTDRGHVVHLDERALARAVADRGDPTLEIRTSEPLRAVAARFALVDPSRPAYHWDGVGRHELAPGTGAARSLTLRLYENGERPRAEWPALAWSEP